MLGGRGGGGGGGEVGFGCGVSEKIERDFRAYINIYMDKKTAGGMDGIRC